MSRRTVRRCWFHRWRDIDVHGIGSPCQHQRCDRCGRERYFPVAP